MPGVDDYNVTSFYNEIPGLSDTIDQAYDSWDSWRAGGGGIQRILRMIRKNPGNNMFTQSALNMAGMATQASQVLGTGYDPAMPQNVVAMQNKQGAEETRRKAIGQAQQLEVGAYMDALGMKQQNRALKQQGISDVLKTKAGLIADTTKIEKKSSFWDKFKSGLQIAGQVASFFDPTGISQMAQIAGGVGGLFGGGGGMPSASDVSAYGVDDYTG